MTVATRPVFMSFSFDRELRARYLRLGRLEGSPRGYVMPNAAARKMMRSCYRQLRQAGIDPEFARHALQAGVYLNLPSES